MTGAEDLSGELLRRAAAGDDQAVSALPLRRAIEHLLEDPLAEQLLHGDFEGKDTITVRVGEADGEKKLVFDATGTAQPPELVRRY
jgi:ATP-dependent Clp protease ATP-binding subunit ClpA